MGWGSFPPDEIERRRIASVAAFDKIKRADWDREYQETCDRMYWSRGQCCAGCDHWSSDAGLTGNCIAAGIVSGADVIASMGCSFSSYMPPPGFPFTNATFFCGKFRDDFDWSTLDPEYLDRIGARRLGVLRAKPQNALAKQGGEE